MDLAGGTLDCWPIYNLIPSCVTLNVSISLFTHAKLTPLKDEKIILDSRFLKERKVFSSQKEFFKSLDPNLTLLQKTIEPFSPKKGFHLEWSFESPVGAGLGGSSSLIITLMKAFSCWLEEPFDLKQAVTAAHNIEAQVLKKPTGTQDYFPCWIPGFHQIEYGVHGFHHRLLPFEKKEFEQRALIFYTGKPHHSGLNNWKVIRSLVDGDEKVFESLKGISKVATKIQALLKKGAWDELGPLFNEETLLRTSLSPQFVTSQILSFQKEVLEKGASGLKVCGAGGGGCVLVWCERDKKDFLEKTFSKTFQALPFHVVDQ